MAIADVTVLGGGIFGLSVAYACVRRGARVKVIEATAIAAGSSGGLVGALAPHTPERWNAKKQFQFESLILAESWWHDIAAASGQDPGYARLGRLQAIADDRAQELAEARAEEAQTLWQGLAEWRVASADAYAGWGPELQTGLVIHDTLSARLHPRKATLALAEALRRTGADVVIGAAETEGTVVEATGLSGLEELSQTLGQTVGNGVKGQAALLDFDARDRPQLYVDGLHIVPHTDGTVGVGSTSEREYADGDSTDSLLEDIVNHARNLCPALRDAPVIDRWAGVRPRARSRAPMLGAHPLRPDHFIANGGFKIGFGMAPKVGEVMADLVLEGRDTIPDDFRPEASLPKA